MTLEDRIRAKQAPKPQKLAEPIKASNYEYDCGLCSTLGHMVKHTQSDPCPKEPRDEPA